MFSSQPTAAMSTAAMPLGGVHLLGCASRARGARVCRATSASSATNATPSRTVRTPKTLGWGERRGAIHPDDPLLTDPATFGYCVYSHADWSHAYKSVSLTRGDDEAEHDLERCEVWGVIPAALRGGVLYRNGPALFERGGVEYKHMLDGDGMVCRFEFGDGDEGEPGRPDAREKNASRVSFASRFVRTEAFTEEAAEDATTRRGPFGTARAGGFAANAFDLRQKNLANTNVLAWGGRVYALYEAGRPVRLEPVSLRCLGEDNLEGKLEEGMFVSAGLPKALERALGVGGSAFTAHPHVDPNTQKLVAWSWKSLVAERAVETTFYEWDVDWQEPNAPTSHVLDGCEAAPHDFAVTASHYVLIQNRLKVDPAPYVLGAKGAGECLVSQPELPVVVHVVPRPSRRNAEAGTRENEKNNTEQKNETPRRAVSAPGPRASFEIHVAFAHDGPPIADDFEVPNGADDADYVTAYTAGWDELSPGSFLGEWKRSEPWPFPVATKLSPDFNNIPRTLLWRYVVNVRTSEVTRVPAPGCEDLCIDHPHVNPLFEGRRECRYVYASLSNEQRASGPPLGYVRIDVRTGETQKWYAGNKTFCEELVVVPKDGKWVGTNADPGDRGDERGSSRIGGDEADAPPLAPPEEEQECWLLGMLADHGETPGGRTCVAVFDGADVSAGPVAKIFLKHRVPHGLHGAFVPRRERTEPRKR